MIDVSIDQGGHQGTGSDRMDVGVKLEHPEEKRAAHIGSPLNIRLVPPRRRIAIDQTEVPLTPTGVVSPIVMISDG